MAIAQPVISPLAFKAGTGYLLEFIQVVESAWHRVMTSSIGAEMEQICCMKDHVSRIVGEIGWILLEEITLWLFVRVLGMDVEAYLIGTYYKWCTSAARLWVEKILRCKEGNAVQK